MIKKHPVDGNMVFDLGFQTYEINFVDMIPGRGVQMGTCNRVLGNIFILDDPRLPDEEVVNTLLHEILHAVYRSRDIQEDDEEERAVSGMADGLTEIFVRNPHILEWITDRLAGEMDDAE